MGQIREETGTEKGKVSGLWFCCEHPASPASPGACPGHPADTKNRHLKNVLTWFSHWKIRPRAARCHVPVFLGVGKHRSTLSSILWVRKRLGTRSHPHSNPHRWRNKGTSNSRATRANAPKAPVMCFWGLPCLNVPTGCTKEQQHV